MSLVCCPSTVAQRGTSIGGGGNPWVLVTNELGMLSCVDMLSYDVIVMCERIAALPA